MTRVLARVALATAAAAAVSVIAWAVYGSGAFVDTVEILAPLGVVAVLLAEVIAAHPAWLRGLRIQFAALAALVAVLLGAAVALFAWLMFVSNHDALFMALATGYAAIVGLGVARLVSKRALSDLDAIRQALHAVGEGARAVSIPVRRRDELAALAADVEAMVGKVGDEEAARRRLVAAVSHDLRTPITSLRLIAEGLEDGLFEPERTSEQLRALSVHVRALSALIDDLFELSRLEAGDIRWSIEQVELDALVRDTIDAMRPHADAARIAVRAEIPDPLTPARGNPEQLQRVLFNLIQNAIRHTPADGSVVVRAQAADGPAIEVEVSDTGAGIERGIRQRIFEPFVQGPSREAGETGSAGLGLAIARAIVEAHGGRIWLADGGPGTHIRFSVPALAE
jgi:signal transduction histidine kinase